MKSKASVPEVGQPVRGSRTGRPIMVALDLLGRRGCLRVLWELRGDQPLTFRALQDAAETNPSLLNTRLVNGDQEARLFGGETALLTKR